MKVIECLAFSLTLLGASIGLTDVCGDNSCPNGKEATNVCLVDSGSFKQSKWTIRAQCGAFSDIYVVDSIEDTAQKLSEMAKSCKSIKRLITAGHAYPGSTLAGNLNLQTIEKLAPYSCLFEQMSEIQFKGCNVGKGCIGDLFFHAVASTLLTKGGIVTGPTDYYDTELCFIGFSVNGKSRKLTYNPSDKGLPYKWEITGLAISNGDSGPKHCANEINESLKKIQTDSENKELVSCAYGYDFYDKRLEAKDIEAYQTLSSSLSKQESFAGVSLMDVDLSLATLERVANYLQYCENENSQTGKNKHKVIK
jgi:hypothetical protein